MKFMYPLTTKKQYNTVSINKTKQGMSYIKKKTLLAWILLMLKKRVWQRLCSFNINQISYVT
jgi:hypothetical protein